MAPPTIGAVIGLTFGAVTWFRDLVIGDGAPLRVIQDCLKLLGDGTIPCTTLVLGGNLIQGLRSSKVKPSVIMGILFVKYLLLPVIGIGVVKAADCFGFLPPDPLYSFVLMLQFTMPPAMSIGTMAQLFDVGQEECAVIFLWTYLFAALALTFWSTVLCGSYLEQRIIRTSIITQKYTFVLKKKLVTDGPCSQVISNWNFQSDKEFEMVQICNSISWLIVGITFSSTSNASL